MNCEKELIEPPPPDMLHSDFSHAFLPPKENDVVDLQSRKKLEGMEPKQAKREAFMLCSIMNSVNEALVYHKQMKCGTSGNYNKTYSVHKDPTKY